MHMVYAPNPPQKVLHRRLFVTRSLLHVISQSVPISENCKYLDVKVICIILGQILEQISKQAAYAELKRNEMMLQCQPELSNTCHTRPA